MTHIEDVLLLSLGQSGDRYIFGAEAKSSDPNPGAFDCSELIEWSCDRAGVKPKVPDGAFNQWQHSRKAGLALPVGKGLVTRGACLWVGDGTGQGRNAITHVAWSLGDGTTIEARGKRWGVGVFPSTNRFQYAGLLPGIDYTPGHPRLPEENELNNIQDKRLYEVWQLINKNIGEAIGRIDARTAKAEDRLAAIEKKLSNG